MKTRLVLVLLLVLATLTQGCIIPLVAAGGFVASRLLMRRAVYSGDMVSMDFHTDLETTWRAAYATAHASGEMRDTDQAPPGPAGRILQVGDMRATVKPLDPKDLGTRIEIVSTSSRAVAPERAEAFLEAVASRLNDFSELVHDFPSGFQDTWNATLAKLDELGRKPTPTGRKATSDRGRVLVDDLWIEVERLGGNVTRVHVFLRKDATAEQVREANTLIDGIDARLRR